MVGRRRAGLISFFSSAKPLPGELTVNNAEKRIARLVEISASQQLAARLNKKMGSQACIQHPDFPNEVSVDLSDKEQPFRVTACCCDEFREQLKEMEENQVLSLKS